MVQSQKPKTMKVEMMKSIKNWAFLNAHFEIHNGSAFSNHAKATCHYQNLVIAKQRKIRYIHSQNEGEWILGGPYIYI